MGKRDAAPRELPDICPLRKGPITLVGKGEGRTTRLGNLLGSLLY